MTDQHELEPLTFDTMRRHIDELRAQYGPAVVEVRVGMIADLALRAMASRHTAGATWPDPLVSLYGVPFALADDLPMRTARVIYADGTHRDYILDVEIQPPLELGPFVARFRR